MTATPVTLTNGLVSYFSFDSGTGTTVSDAVGGNTGTWEGALGSQWGAGKINSGGSFTGTDYVAGPDGGFPLGTAAGSVSLWFDPSQTCADQVLFAYGSRSTGQARGITCQSGTSITVFGWGADQSFTVPTTAGWHLATFTYSGSSITFYYDGAPVNTYSVTWNTVSSGSYYVGANLNLGNMFTGQIDEVGVWSRSLSASEVAALYSNGSGLAYPFVVVGTPVTSTYSISGTVFVDTNGSGVQDPGETGYAGATVSLTGPITGSTTTTASGGYAFTGLSLYGDYTVSVTLPSGYLATGPMSATVTNLTGNQVFNFGIAPSSAVNDVSSQMHLLGNPFKTFGNSFATTDLYSDNVWDMQSFNNRVYLGYGDAVANAGPIPLLYYDPVAGQFTTDTISNAVCGTNCVDDEQLNSYRNLGGTLYIPGWDPHYDNSNGAFYRLSNGVWQEFDDVPGAIHDFDIYQFQGQLFITTTSTTGIDIYVSSDSGNTWTNVTFTNAPTGFAMSGAPLYYFFELGGQLYDSTWWNGGHALAQYQGNNTFTYIDPSVADGMFPGATQALHVYRATSYANQLVYLGVYDEYNIWEWASSGLFRTTSISGGSQVRLPFNATAWDVLTGTDGKLYALGVIPSGTNQYVVTVDETTDLVNWKEDFRFNADTFARSFEYLNGYFYFGLGTYSTALAPDTGNILRVPWTMATTTPTMTPSPTATP